MSGMFSELPRFPCNSSKRPLTPHGFMDARRNVDTSGWELVGIVTGAVSGLDVLDVDVEGMEWLQSVELPATRVQVTRSGGKHFFFKHAEGLRCSTSRVALSVDVRANGGYAIDWEREGFPTEEREIVDWPGWLLALAMRPGNSRRNLAPISHSPIGMNAWRAPAGSSLLWKLNPIDYRGHDDWVRVMMSAHEAGIDREDWIRWCVSDPAYANEADEVGRRWDNLKVDRITGWALRVEIRLQELNRGICPKYGKPKPDHMGLGHGLLCKVPLTAPTIVPTKTFDLRARVSYWLNQVEKGDEDLLFRASCVMREIIAEGLLSPRVAVQLLESSWPKKKHPQVNARRVIAAAFLAVEQKLHEQMVGTDATIL